MAKKELKYNDAVAEIEAILERISTGELDVDRIGDEVKRAAELLALCREKLRAAEETVNKVLGS